MQRIAAWLLTAGLASVAVASEPAPPVQSVSEIIAKNIAARGGLDAWRHIQTMVWVGHIETAHAPAAKLPFILDQKRPNKTRFEITVQNQRALRLFDGSEGWKTRPSANGQPEWQAFTGEELRYAHDGPGLDGLLMDAADRGLAIRLDGVATVDGNAAYQLNVQRPSGGSERVWIDAQTFLDIKSERTARTAAGQAATATVVYRHYQTLEGVQMPMIMETGTVSASASANDATDRMVIDQVVVNPPLEDALFAKPQVPGQHRGVRVDTRQAALPARSTAVSPFPHPAEPLLEPVLEPAH